MLSHGLLEPCQSRICARKCWRVHCVLQKGRFAVLHGVRKCPGWFPTVLGAAGIGVSGVPPGGSAGRDNGGGGLSTAAIIAVAAACAVLFVTLLSVFGIILRNRRAKQYDGNSQPSLRTNTVRDRHTLDAEFAT